MQAPMDVGIFLTIGTLDRVQHYARLLRRGAVVEIDKRLAVHLAGEDGEVGADRVHVEGRRNRLEILGRRSEDGHGRSFNRA